MHILLIIFALVFAFMLGVYNGFFLKFNDATPEEKKLAGTQFHGFGFILRASLLILWIPFIGEWTLLEWAFYLSLYLWVAFVLYDGMCNLLRPHLPGNLYQKFFYSGSAKSGTTSIIDKLLGEYLPIIKVAFTGVELFFVAYVLWF